MTRDPAWFHFPQFHWHNKKAIIIGGGIAGAQIAWHLCQNGWQVTLIERHKKLASEASGNPAGIISPKMTAVQSVGEDFYTQSFLYTLSQLEKLQQQGHQIMMDNCGVLQLAHNAREIKRWYALKKRQFPSQFIQLLDEHETQQIAGIKLHKDQVYKSCYFPSGGWIQPASFVKALSSHSNCNIITETTALKLRKKNKLWHIYNKENQSIEQAEVAIVANGKDLFQFKQTAFLAGLPIAGQTTMALSSAYSRQLNTVIGHQGYLTPALPASVVSQATPESATKQKHIFGATYERNQSKPMLSDASNQENINCLKHYLPEFANSLSDFSSAHVAVRMTTPDRFPYAGAVPDLNFYKENYSDLHQGKQWKQYPPAQYQTGLFVLGGLGSRGLITSGFCAKALCNLLENQLESDQTMQTLINTHPARFIIKRLKQNQLIDSVI